MWVIAHLAAGVSRLKGTPTELSSTQLPHGLGSSALGSRLHNCLLGPAPRASKCTFCTFMISGICSRRDCRIWKCARPCSRRAIRGTDAFDGVAMTTQYSHGGYGRKRQLGEPSRACKKGFWSIERSMALGSHSRITVNTAKARGK